MDKCFVIQPFDDGGKYDKRYYDIFEPAIKESNYEPYRVDNDPSVEIPIENIDSNIRTSFAVLADITEDNPNVWFEVGLAIAYKKKIILVCSAERTGKKYPFDIQHHSIISYKNESLSDFDKLKNDIINKLKAYSKEKNSIMNSANQTGILSESDLSDEAIIVLGIIGNNMMGTNIDVTDYAVSQDMFSIGYNRLALNFAIRELKTHGFIKETSYNNPEETEAYYIITEEGFAWMIKNKSRFNLVTEKKQKDNKSSVQSSFPEDIPF